jgi:multiphosphoryl transfer protein
LWDAASRVLRRLGAAGEASFALTEPAIVAARDLLPSEVEKLDPALVLGLCLETGSASAHAAILVRSRGIPAVVGLGPALSTVAEGTIAALDGERGSLRLSPSEQELRRIEERRRDWLHAREAAEAKRRSPAATSDGRGIAVLANISRDTEVLEALEQGAEGVGVLRTEFLFLHRSTPPDEEEQLAAYRTIAQALGPRPLVVRTLDIGGDKSVPYIEPAAEANPFLGWRGVRLTLGRRDLFETQLRAILRAAHQHPVEVLLPMVSSLAELREAKAILSEAADALRRAGVPFRENIPVGVMIEVPAAVAIADLLASEACRLSIGTNDLVQYAMAADRTNSRVAPIADHFQPAVLRMIRDTVAAARQAGIRVDVCGEMAADRLAVPLLLGLGVDELSVSAPLVAEVKDTIRAWSIADAEVIAREALAAQSSGAVRQLLSSKTNQLA